MYRFVGWIDNAIWEGLRNKKNKATELGTQCTNPLAQIEYVVRLFFMSSFSVLKTKLLESSVLFYFGFFSFATVFFSP